MVGAAGDLGDRLLFSHIQAVAAILLALWLAKSSLRCVVLPNAREPQVPPDQRQDTRLCQGSAASSLCELRQVST